MNTVKKLKKYGSTVDVATSINTHKVIFLPYANSPDVSAFTNRTIRVYPTGLTEADTLKLKQLSEKAIVVIVNMLSKFTCTITDSEVRAKVLESILEGNIAIFSSKLIEMLEGSQKNVETQKIARFPRIETSRRIWNDRIYRLGLGAHPRSYIFYSSVKEKQDQFLIHCLSLWMGVVEPSFLIPSYDEDRETDEFGNLMNFDESATESDFRFDNSHVITASERLKKFVEQSKQKMDEVQCDHLVWSPHVYKTFQRIPFGAEDSLGELDALIGNEPSGIITFVVNSMENALPFFKKECSVVYKNWKIRCLIKNDMYLQIFANLGVFKPESVLEMDDGAEYKYLLDYDHSVSEKRKNEPNDGTELTLKPPKKKKVTE